VDRIFLDANVLFSAAYRPDAGLARLARLWRLEGVELITSAYAAEEAKLNLTEEDQRARLTELLKKCREKAGCWAEPFSIRRLERSRWRLRRTCTLHPF